MKKYEQILKYAMQMEMDGHNFFKEKADEFINPTTRELFLTLAEVEMEHYDLLKEQLECYLETDAFDLDTELMNRDESSIFEDREESEHIDETVKESDIPDITVLRMAYLIEKDFAEFYRKAAKKAAEEKDKDAEALFSKLAKWEDGHEKLFKKEYDRRMEEYMTLPWGG